MGRFSAPHDWPEKKRALRPWGLHEAIAKRVLALVKRFGIADKFVITGGIGRNVGLVSRIEERLDRGERAVRWDVRGADDSPYFNEMTH